MPKKRGPYTVISSRVAYKNPWIQVREDAVIRPGGSEGIFGVIEMVAGASVLPIASDGSVYLVEEYKYGIGRNSLEVISGALNNSESPVEAAKRELEEELGLTASSWKDLGVVDPFTTVVRSPNYLFLAQELGGGQRNPDEGEEVRAVRMPFDEALRRVLECKITHSASCVLILKAARLLGR